MGQLESESADIKAKQISQLEWMAQELVEAWGKSKQNAVATKTILDLSGDGGSERKETTIKGQTGNATYLDSAASKLSDVRKILGLDAPVRAESVVSLAVPQLDALNQAYGETTGESADRPTGESTDGPATHSHGDDANPVE